MESHRADDQSRQPKIKSYRLIGYTLMGDVLLLGGVAYYLWVELHIEAIAVVVLVIALASLGVSLWLQRKAARLEEAGAPRRN